MDLVNLLSKLQAIEVQEGLSDKQKEIAKQAGDPDKIEGEDFAALKKKKANEDIESVLRGLKAIQEASLEEDDVEEGNEFAKKVQDLKAQGAKPGTKFKTSDGKEHVLEAEESCPKCGEVHEGACDKTKVDECGDMEMSPLTNPSAGYDMTPMAAMAPQAEPEMAAEPVEEKPQFTLTIRNGDSNLSMTTDTPDEIIHVMKLAGIPGKAEVKKAAPEQQGQEKEVEEAWANTPDQTGEKEPTAYGDIRDWARKGTGAGKPNYPGTKASGDNPLAEQTMFEEYKRFKTTK